jgi:hypothetical protein
VDGGENSVGIFAASSNVRIDVCINVAVRWQPELL